MRLDIFGSAQARRGGPHLHRGAVFRDFLEHHVEAEALVFHISFVVEHHFTGLETDLGHSELTDLYRGPRPPALRVDTAEITLPWHNPVLVAEQAATIDLLSRGRLNFRVGQVYRHNEFAGFCLPIEEADALLEDALEPLLKACTSDSPWSYHGKH